MSVLIRGVELPKNCSECPVALSSKYCRINQTYTTYRELPFRPDHCPLVELPEHHGRIIDEDEMKCVKMYLGSFEQIKWERDVAIRQLNDYGKQFGER